MIVEVISFILVLILSVVLIKKKPVLGRILLVIVTFLYIGIGIYNYYSYKNLENILNEKQDTLNNLVSDGTKLESLEIEKSNIEEEITTLESDISSLENEITTLNTTYQELYDYYKDIPIFQIDNFPTFNQLTNGFYNGCESVALYLLLTYNGVDVTPDDIVNKLKKGVAPYQINGVWYGGNPETEFLGDPKSTKGWGVFEGPIVDVANYYKEGIKNISGTSLDEVLEIVRSGKPVQVWASMYNRKLYSCRTWYNSETNSYITWNCNFHSLVLIGTTSNKVIVSDPLTGSIEYYERDAFEESFNTLGKRAIYYE